MFLSKQKKLVFWFAAAVVFLFCAYEFLGRQFCLKNITYDVSLAEPVSLRGTEEALLKDLLNQPYTYLDRGRQSYVFTSRDGRYVLKFFDMGRYKPNWLKSLLNANSARMESKMHRLLNAYKLAFERDREFSMILFLQLQPNPQLKQMVSVKDRFGFEHVLDLKKTPFVIQRKAVPAREEITRLLLDGHLERAKVRFKQLLGMYAAEHRKGIYDCDHNVMYNTGFVGEHPIRLDVGRLRVNERLKNLEFSQEELNKIVVERAGGWLQRHFPQYREELLNAISPVGKKGKGLIE